MSGRAGWTLVLFVTVYIINGDNHIIAQLFSGLAAKTKRIVRSAVRSLHLPIKRQQRLVRAIPVRRVLARG